MNAAVTAGPDEELLSAAAVAQLKGCDPHTVTGARDRHELRGVLVRRRWRYRPVDVDAWIPRPRGGQRRHEILICQRDGCDRQCTQDSEWCSKSHAALDREADKRVELVTEAAAIGAVPVQAILAPTFGVGRRGALSIVRRHSLPTIRSNVTGFGRPPLLVPSVELERVRDERVARRANQLRALAHVGTWWSDTKRGRVFGQLPPAPGKQRRGRPEKQLTPDQLARIRFLVAAKWGLHAIAADLEVVGWRVVKQVRDELLRDESVSHPTLFGTTLSGTEVR